MNLSPVEWFQAQSLLLKLVQVLTPFSNLDSPPFYILDKRFFFTPPEELNPMNRSVEELGGLLKEIEEWSDEGKKLKALPMPLASQAKRLLKEVQKVIGQLSSSYFLKEPTEEPVCEAFTQIFPQLELFVKRVQEERGGEGENLLPSMFPPTPFFKVAVKKKKKKKKPFEEEPLTESD